MVVKADPEIKEYLNTVASFGNNPNVNFNVVLKSSRKTKSHFASDEEQSIISGLNKSRSQVENAYELPKFVKRFKSPRQKN